MSLPAISQMTVVSDAYRTHGRFVSQDLHIPTEAPHSEENKDSSSSDSSASLQVPTPVRKSSQAQRLWNENMATYATNTSGVFSSLSSYLECLFTTLKTNKGITTLLNRDQLIEITKANGTYASSFECIKANAKPFEKFYTHTEIQRVLKEVCKMADQNLKTLDWLKEESAGNAFELEVLKGIQDSMVKNQHKALFKWDTSMKANFKIEEPAAAELCVDLLEVITPTLEMLAKLKDA